MKSILFFLALVPCFVFAQNAKTKEAPKAKTEAKTTTAKPTEAKPSEAKPATEVKTSTKQPTTPAPTGGIYVCGSSDVYHTDRNCSALKRCKSEPTTGKGSAKNECKMCAKAKANKSSNQ